MDAMCAFLGTPFVQSLVDHHPNSILTQPPPAEWTAWWTWAGTASDPWRALLDSHVALPPELQLFLESLHSLPTSISRDRGVAGQPETRSRGMPAKKAHEVGRMVGHIASLLPPNVQHVVDVGAGQGYLSRALRDDLHLNVLALDSSEIQTNGAQRRDPPAKHFHPGSLTHNLVHITPSSLHAAITDWMPYRDPPTPLFLVALHACGSLTPDILRVLLAPSAQTWTPVGAVVVGCCYNLLAPTDFPLSRTLSLTLTPTHLQLAAQTPQHWLDTPSSTQAARLATRKVAYRALLEAYLPSPPPTKRLGRLPDSAYASWEVFLDRASNRMGVDLQFRVQGQDENKWREESERRLSVLHVLRCLLGPAIETLILLDRLEWIRGQIRAFHPHMDVQLVKLFDQATGSARNVAIVVTPVSQDPAIRPALMQSL